MDKETRNRIQRATQAARALLEREYGEQLDGLYDIRLDGTIAAEPGSHLDAEQRVLRTKLVAAVDHERAAGVKPAEAVAQYLREAAFTTLNRFVALKMLESRGLVQECISRGDQSVGFKEFTGLAPGLVQLPDHGYRLYIESLFDEIGREVRVLFDRRDPASLLWPRRQTLTDLQAILNAADLASVWGEDETIGWVYQYFNLDEERRQMRAESQAPRNSRELAVRNQFFTPRYVVQFLTDNTLGRIWYEMRQGETKLSDLDYLVRRPDEVFLADSGEPPAQDDTADENLSPEELLKKTVHVPFRAKKDPRDLKILDPACGSGHFLLYACDLLLVIYEEGWADDAAPRSDSTGKTLSEDYPDRASLRAAAPGLILRHNLHGIDIDPRCAQIAALALWMRAHRAFKDLGISRDARPPIQKTNIVVAEPMPGEPELRREFVATLEPKLGKLVERVFERMELAGEAGSLLRIEDDIRDAVREILGDHGELFRASDEERWSQAENDVLKALKDYSERATSGRTFQRRLFAEDATRGFGFVDVCLRRHDVVVMNPPFGRPTDALHQYLQSKTTDHYQDVAAAFIARAQLWSTDASVGAIAPRPMLIMRYLEHWRRSTLLPHLDTLVDLGTGVMDDAIVRACCYLLSRGSGDRKCNVVLATSQPESALRHLRQSWMRGDVVSSATIMPLSAFGRLPFGRIPFRLPMRLLRLFDGAAHFEPAVGTARQGPTTSDDFRFLRLWWEVPASEIGRGRRWERHAKGGGSGFYYRPIRLLIKRHMDGAELAAFNMNINGQTAQSRQGSDYYYRPGSQYSYRSVAFAAAVLPADCVMAHIGPAVLSERAELPAKYLLGWLNSRVVRSLIHIQSPAEAYPTGLIKKLPWLDPTESVCSLVSATAETLVRNVQDAHVVDDRDPWHRICLRPLPRTEHDSMVAKWSSAVAEATAFQAQLDTAVARLYGIDDPADVDEELCPEIDWKQSFPSLEPRAFASQRMGELLGYGFERYAGTSVPELGRADALSERRDIFSPLPPEPPSCTLGTVRPEPFNVLADDEGAKHDVVDVLRASTRQLLGASEEAYLDDLVRLAGRAEKGIRRWLCEEWFGEHIARYTDSHRCAPVYWQLSTPSVVYSVWLYYHRLTRDTLYRVLNDHVTTKLHHEERRLTSLVQDAGQSATATHRKEIDAQERLVAEVRAFYEEVARVAPLWNPDLNDGVIINFAPLWRLVPQHKPWQKECKACWDKLVAGDYDWAHLAMHLWPERVVPKCMTDRSLAIAHGLDALLWEEGQDGKWKPKKVGQDVIDRLIADRTSASVKAALKSLMDAPAPSAGRGAGRRSASPRRAAGAGKKERQAAPPRPDGTGDNAIDRVREAIAEAADGVSKAEVVAATGINDGQWNTAINALLSQGLVTKTGERRGARYHAAGGKNA